MSLPRVFIASGPSGVGKSSIIRGALARRPEVRMTVSTTTRPRRAGEQEGREYFFVDVPTFERMIAREEFLEWARSYDNYYGTGIRQIESILADRHHALLDVDTQGTLNIQRQFSGAVLIFIQPPDLATLEARLRGRGSESEATLRKRLARAEEEMSFSDRYDHVIVNHTLEDSIQAFLAIIDREKERPVIFMKKEVPGADAMARTAEKATRYAMEQIDQETLVASLEGELQTALRGELEELIRERLEQVLRHDLQRIVEETYRETLEGLAAGTLPRPWLR
jgi:guanylate kinase